MKGLKKYSKEVKMFYNSCEQHEDCEDILSDMRSLNSNGEISNDAYYFIVNNWDDLLSIGGFL